MTAQTQSDMLRYDTSTARRVSPTPPQGSTVLGCTPHGCGYRLVSVYMNCSLSQQLDDRQRRVDELHIGSTYWSLKALLLFFCEVKLDRPCFGIKRLCNSSQSWFFPAEDLLLTFQRFYIYLYFWFYSKAFGHTVFISTFWLKRKKKTRVRTPSVPATHATMRKRKMSYLANSIFYCLH